MGFKEKYNDYILKWGRILTGIGILSVLVLPAYLWIRYKAGPSWSQMSAGYLTILAMFGVAYVSDMIGFYPTTGAAPIYLGYFSGNMSAVRLPAMFAAQQALGYKQGTKGGEVVGIIAVAASVYMSTFAVTVIALVGGPIIDALPQFVVDSLTYVTPAIMGAMGCIIAEEDLKAFGIAIVLSVLITVVGLPSWATFPAAILGTMFICVALYQNSKNKENKEKKG